DYLRAGWQGISGGGEGWRQALQRGGVFAPADNSGLLPQTAPAAGGAAAGAVAGVTAQQQAHIATSGQAPTVVQPDVEQQPPATPAPAGLAGAVQAVQFEGAEDANFNLVVYPSYRFYDGRTANRPWLLELPDPVTKVSWMSWVEIHPRAAASLGISQGDVVEVASPYGSL